MRKTQRPSNKLIAGKTLGHFSTLTFILVLALPLNLARFEKKLNIVQAMKPLHKDNTIREAH